MSRPELPRQDMHVHSTFSDGRSTLAENVEEAETLGLTELTCVDHVRADTDWVPEYVAAVRAARATTHVRLWCAVEAKILDTSGALDAPADLRGVDFTYAADHQVPLDDGPHHPREICEDIDAGRRAAADVLEALVTATAKCLRADVVIAHLFSVLPKIGLEEDDVPMALIERLADAAAAAGARIEVDERWSCPSARTVAPFVARGVPLLLSTDSHRRETIGRYDFCAAVWDATHGADVPA